jgi:hypothetical protein
MKFRKKDANLAEIFLFGFSLYYNRGISVVCSNCFKCVEVFQKSGRKRFFSHTLTLYFPTKLLYIESLTRSNVALGLPPSS